MSANRETGQTISLYCHAETAEFILPVKLKSRVPADLLTQGVKAGRSIEIHPA
jgi:hypothetical protein